MKGLTRKQATEIAKTLRLHKNQVYKIYIEDNKLKFNKIEVVPENKKAGALFTGSWNRILDIQHKLTQSLLADILYVKVNSDISKIERDTKVSGEVKKENKYPKLNLSEYIGLEQLEVLISKYIFTLGDNYDMSTNENRYQYLYYNRKRDIVHLGTELDRKRGGYLEGIVVYSMENNYGKVRNLESKKAKAHKMAELAYRGVNSEIREYWRDLYEDFEDEL